MFLPALDLIFRELKHRGPLSQQQSCHQNGLSVRKVERIVMLRRIVRTNLPKARDPLMDRPIQFEGACVPDILVEGEHLEGKGVTPDVPVAAGLPYAEGRDPQLEQALDVALGMAGRVPY